MKIYTKVVLDIASGEVERSESFEYNGPIAECKGGGSSSTTTVDYAYNDRMAGLSERQQDMAEEYFDFWKQYQAPYEQQQLAANQALLPTQTDLASEQIASQRELLSGQTALQKAQNESALGLLPLTTEATRAQLQDSITAMKERAPVRSAYYNAALQGVDVADQIGKARNSTASAFADAGKTLTRNAAGLGLSGLQYANKKSDLNLNRALMGVGASESARTNAENESFNRLKGAMSFGTSMGGNA